MKRFLVPCLLLALPMLAFSQQKNNSSSQQFQKEMEQLRSEMKQQISALQDSLVKLKEELNKKDVAPVKPFGWSYQYSFPEKLYMEPYLDEIERYFEEHKDEMSAWREHFEIPEIPELPEAPEAPESPGIHEWEHYFEAPDAPPAPKAPHWNYHFEMPPMPELERVLPPHPEDWKFDLRMPEFYDHYWRKHDSPEREKFLEMLPFYNLFKS